MDTLDASNGRIYIAIDLKSFYASVECIERGLNPLTANLVVADQSRTEKSICLAVSPSLRAFGIPGRSRLFEVIEKVKEINANRLTRAPGRRFTGSSWDSEELAASPCLSLDYIVAPPRMALYMKKSAEVYSVYLRYVAPEDIHIYSIDEVFMDITHYLKACGLTARQFTQRILLDVLKTTGITATAGMGTNLYLCKIAMDIGAKHTAPDENGVRIACLDEAGYRRTLWTHRPLTDFWRVGRGYAKKLEAHGLYTMGDIARCSLGRDTDYYNEDLLYRLFGVNAELLIDHAWGWEPCTIADIKAYRPADNSIGSGQVLSCPYPSDKARLVVQEMADQLALDLLDKRLVTDQLVLTVGYDSSNTGYSGDSSTDRYGRSVPKHGHGSTRFTRPTSSARQLACAAAELFDRIADPSLLVRRLNLTAAHVTAEALSAEGSWEQLSLFSGCGDFSLGQDDKESQKKEMEKEALERERKAQEAMLAIKKKYGKNAVLKGMNLEEGATAKERNKLIGGHKA